MFTGNYIFYPSKGVYVCMTCKPQDSGFPSFFNFKLSLV